TGRRVESGLARVVESDPHRLSVGAVDHSRTIAQRHEAVGVEPLRKPLLVGRNGDVFEIAVVDEISPGEWRSALISVYALYLPAANDPRHDSVGTGQELTAFPERQFINRAQREPVGVVLI